MRFVLEDAVGIELPPQVRKTIDLEGRIVRDGVDKSLKVIDSNKSRQTKQPDRSTYASSSHGEH